MTEYLLLVVLPNIKHLLILFCIAATFPIIILLISIGMKIDAINTKEERNAILLMSKTIAWLAAICVGMIFIGAFFPTKREILQLQAISIVAELRNAHKIPQELFDRLNNILDSKDD